MANVGGVAFRFNDKTQPKTTRKNKKRGKKKEKKGDGECTVFSFKDLFF